MLHRECFRRARSMQFPDNTCPLRLSPSLLEGGQTHRRPTSTLLEARHRHRRRHNSWQIAVRLVSRLEDQFETLLWQGKDVEAATIRLRIAKEEESKSRASLDKISLELMGLKRSFKSTTSPKGARRSRMPTSSSSSSYSSISSSSSTSSGMDECPPLPDLSALRLAEKTFKECEQLQDPQDHVPHGSPIRLTKRPALGTSSSASSTATSSSSSNSDFVIQLGEMHKLEKKPARLVHCSCGAACLCSVVSSWFT